MLAFTHLSKTAGTTITQLLRQSFGARHCDVRLWPHDPHSPRVMSAADLQRLSIVYWHLASIAGHHVVPYGDLCHAHPDLRFYTFCREPLARLASHYQSLVQKRPMADDFFAWIKTGEYWNWQTQGLAGRPDADAAIEMLKERFEFVGLTEHFNESLVMFRRWSDQPQINIRYVSHNVAGDNSIKQRLLADPASRDALTAANQEDLKLYDYVVREIYPRQRKAYGASLADDVAEFEAFDDGTAPTVPMFGTFVRNCVYKPLMPLTTRGQLPARPTPGAANAQSKKIRLTIGLSSIHLFPNF